MKNLIINYISNMNINDVNNFAINNNITLSEEELIFTYNFIKKNYLVLLNDPNLLDMNKYKDRYSEENYNKINELIDNYKKKYNI